MGNPGSKKLRKRDVEGVRWLGALPHHQMLAEVRTALCVFFRTRGPGNIRTGACGIQCRRNTRADACLRSSAGSDRRFTATSFRLNPRDGPTFIRSNGAFRLARRSRSLRRKARCVFEPYVERIRAWRNGERPRTVPDRRFRLSGVAERWRALFADQLSGA